MKVALYRTLTIPGLRPVLRKTTCHITHYTINRNFINIYIYI